MAIFLFIIHRILDNYQDNYNYQLYQLYSFNKTIKLFYIEFLIQIVLHIYSILYRECSIKTFNLALSYLPL